MRVVPPLSRGWAEELHGPYDEVDGGDGGEDDEPEPEDDVDLLVEDVHAEHAERVEPLDGARTSVLVEDALRDKACCGPAGLHTGNIDMLNSILRHHTNHID